MEISQMNLAEVEERLNALEIEVRDMTEVADVDNATEEKKLLLERKKELEEVETRKQIALGLTNGTIAPTKIIESRKEETKMENIEVRNSVEYGKAFLNFVKKGDDAECRALLSNNVSGDVPIPEILETEIKNAWEECKVMSLVGKSSIAGNIKVGFEYSATGASIHVEGTDAPEEEVLELGVVELKAESIKKWITVSDEAIEGTTVDTLGYIYKEVAQKIVEKAEDILIGKIVASPSTSTKTAPAVAIYNASTIDVDTVTMALAELSGKAKNVTLVMNRRTYAAIKAKTKKNNYGVDAFDGCPVVFTDALKSFTSATSGDTYIIAGDFGYGFRANFPSGNNVKLILDDKSLAEKDLVKVVGRQYVGMAVVAENAFVKVTK